MEKLIGLFLFLFITNFSFAQQETLAVDTSFGEDGIYTEENLSEGAFFIFEDKIYIAGKRGPSGSPYFSLIRLNMDGTPDMTFNDGSSYYFNYPQFQFTEYNAYEAIVQQPDGKFLVLMKRYLFRINPDGSVDTGFGNQGIISYPSSVMNFNIGYNDGKIYRIYNIDNGQNYVPVKIERININGETDLEYGDNGILNLGQAPIEASRKTIGFFSNGELLTSYGDSVYKIDVNGNTFITTNYFSHLKELKIKDDYFIVIYIPSSAQTARVKKFLNGGNHFILDNSFGSSNEYAITIHQFYTDKFIQIRNDNKFYILGHAHWYELQNGDWIGKYGYVITRRLENGYADNTFSGNGHYTFQNVPSNPNEHRIQSYKLLNNDIYILAKNVYSNQVHLYKYNLVEELSASEQSNNSLKIYPNPATDKLYFKNLKKNSTVKILNAEGKFIMEKTIEPNGFIDISSLQKGVYVAIVDDNSYKFIKN